MEEPFLKFLRNSYEFFDETIPGGTEFPTNEIILLPPPSPLLFQFDFTLRGSRNREFARISRNSSRGTQKKKTGDETGRRFIAGGHDGSRESRGRE